MAFLHGLLLAFGLILPLGAQNMFVFNQGAVQPRFRRALPAVFTASLCDLLLILLAVLGVSVVVLRLPVVKTILLGIGVLFLLYMGVVTWKSATPIPETTDQVAATQEEPDNSTALALAPHKQIFFAASVSLLNPHAILDTIGVIGTSSLQYQGADKWMFSSACILVSFLWFFFLAGSGRLIGHMKNGILPLLNRVSAMIMWVSALYLLKNFF